ncbi:TetR/AcrR family transcriptional regulator [Luteimonas sp. BDR2-5]|uniref:TetR/AcrR family transcriptional regulator n=1 Tax=Proluteimonas luteida TaxID=2878685 RepID=UPI001E4F4B57|nr:TetR family transcriptional regulator [Luteimonas sp. BDR2-5]
MEQISVEADVARGTLYNHFPTKEAVLAYWMHGQLAEALGPLLADGLAGQSFVAQLARLLEASAAWWEAHRDFAAPYVRHRFQEVRDGAGDAPTSDMILAYQHLIEAAQASGALSTGVPSARLAEYLHFLYLCALMRWLADPRKRLADEFAFAIDFFLQGAAARS